MILAAISPSGSAIMIISADTNPEVFERLGATPYDLSVFKEIGLDIIRLDGHFGETEDIAITAR